MWPLLFMTFLLQSVPFARPPAAILACGVGTSVTSFGAVGNGTTVNNTAIQNALNAMSAGNTLYFPSGAFRITTTMSVPAGSAGNLIHIVGCPGSSVVGYTGTAAAGFPLFFTAGNYISFSGMTFTGGGINLGGVGSPGFSDTITISGSTFQNIINSNGSGPSLAAINCNGWGMQNITISGNTFQNISQGGTNTVKDEPHTAIICPRVNAVTIADNIFDNVNEGIHLVEVHDAGTYDAFHVQRNKFTRVHRMPIEMQTWYLTNALIEDNSMTNYLNPFYNTFGGTFGAGAGAGSSLGTIVRRNFVVMDKVAAGISGTEAGYCLEIYGYDTAVSDNVCESVPPGRWSSMVAVTPYNAGHPAIITENTFCGGQSGAQIIVEPGGSGSYMASGNTTLAGCGGVTPP